MSMVIVIYIYFQVLFHIWKKDEVVCMQEISDLFPKNGKLPNLIRMHTNTIEQSLVYKPCDDSTAPYVWFVPLGALPRGGFGVNEVEYPEASGLGQIPSEEKH